MSKTSGLVERRRFLLSSASFVLGTFFSLGRAPRALASGDGAPPQARIALIIDDVGYNRGRARQFLDLGVPITFAVLPRLTHSWQLAAQIHQEGHEIMLHQPMEPADPGLDPGPGALYVGDEPERIFRVVDENFSSVPSAVGVNNHMGSRFTSCEDKMSEVLGTIKGRGLFFIDSLTSSSSTAYETAKRLHMPAAFRNVFLDNQPDEPSILSQLRRLERHAMLHGRAIGIGHPYPETARAIGRFLKDRRDLSRVPLVHVSGLVAAA